MDDLLEQIATDPWGRLVLQHLASGGLKGNYLFLLVCARLSGVFLVAPCFLAFSTPPSARFGLVFFLSLVVTPALASVTPDQSLISLVSFESAMNIGLQRSLMDLGCEVLSEVSLGALMGVGVIAVLSGLRLGSEWLERQTGLGVGTLLNPDGTSEMVHRSSIIELLGIVVFLTIKPLGGLLLLLQSLLQSFQSIPLGSASWIMSLKDILMAVVQQSFILGLRIAMPLIAAMTLVDVAVAFLSRGIPLPMGSVSLIIRTSISIVILALTMTALPEIVMATSVSVFQSLRGLR